MLNHQSRALLYLLRALEYTEKPQPATVALCNYIRSILRGVGIVDPFPYFLYFLLVFLFWLFYNVHTSMLTAILQNIGNYSRGFRGSDWLEAQTVTVPPGAYGIQILGGVNSKF